MNIKIPRENINLVSRTFLMTKLPRRVQLTLHKDGRKKNTEVAQKNSFLYLLETIKK